MLYVVNDGKGTYFGLFLRRHKKSAYNSGRKARFSQIPTAKKLKKIC